MLRHVLATTVFGILALLVSAGADDPKAPGKKKDEAALREEALLQQQRLANQYRSFERSLLELAQRLDRSTKPEERQRAKLLKEAIKSAGELDIKLKFERLISTLRETKALNPQDLQDAEGQSTQLAQDLRALLALLLSDNREELLKAEIERLKKLMEMLDRVIREQKVVRAQTESGRLDHETLSKAQNKVTEATRNVSRAMEKEAREKDRSGQKDGQQKKDSEGKENSDKQGKGNREGDKSDNAKKGLNDKEKQGKQGDGEKKDTGKRNDGGKKDGSDKKEDGLPQPSDGNQQPDEGQQNDGRQSIEDALRNQRRAEELLRKNQREPASREQDEAIRKLEEARKRLEELLRQMREEEKLQLLAALQARCERMLQMQTAVLEETVRLDKAIQITSDKKPTRTEEQASLKLSDRELEIVRDANSCLQLLAAEGSAVAFAEVLAQVRDDMQAVARRLGRVDVGHVTQATEQDIIAMLKQMIEALKKQQQQIREHQNQPPPPPGDPQQQQRSLIDLLAELRMIRSLQLQVNNRTALYGQQYKGEQADDPEIVKELLNLAQRQQKIFEITNNIARGKNR